MGLGNQAALIKLFTVGAVENPAVIFEVSVFNIDIWIRQCLNALCPVKTIAMPCLLQASMLS